MEYFWIWSRKVHVVYEDGKGTWRPVCHSVVEIRKEMLVHEHERVIDMERMCSRCVKAMSV